MPTAEPRRAGERRWAWPALAVVLVGALALRLWGVRQGLPYAYNVDEADHFVPQAVNMFTGGFDPHYFVNPPAFTYLLHLVFAVWFGGRAGVAQAVSQHPGDLLVVARVTAALLGTGAIWLLYLLGARLFNRAVGLLAATLEAVAFLPVFYAHLALNDVPTLAPLTLSLLGTAGVLREGRRIDYALAGVGLGLGCATKYTAGIVLVPLLVAVAIRYLDRAPAGGAEATDGQQRARLAGGEVSEPADRTGRTIGDSPFDRRTLIGLAIAAAGALLAFLLANPYALLDFHRFHADLLHQSTLSSEAQGKLGAPKQGGLLYYLWSLTWGLGWLPALAALGGAVTVWRSGRLRMRGPQGWIGGSAAAGGIRLGLLLVPAALLFLAFMGLQGRYFGRWLLPIFPIVCLLAAFFALQLANTLARRLPRLRLAAAVLLGAALPAQGLVYSIHSGSVLARADTRNLTRAWMLAHIPAGAPVVVEPFAPDAWGRRWHKYPSRMSVIVHDGTVDPSARRLVSIEDYERTLAPSLIPYYEQKGYCWVVSATTQSGRVLPDGLPLARRAEGDAVRSGTHAPLAVAYYRALAQRAEVAYHASPYARGEGPVAFNFDWTFDYYPLAYHRPGPEVTVYRLRGGRCAGRGYPGER